MPEHMPIHAQDAEQVLQELGVDREQGLDAETVEQRRSEYGPNELQEAETRSWLWILLDQFRSMVVYLLSGAAVLAFATGHLVEGIAIAAVIVVNTAIGFVSEWKAVRSMAALRRLGQQRARARRNGGETGLPAAELVPGDIVLLQAGEVVPADVRLLSAERLRVDQAALTGESVPATKTVQKVEPDTELADRKNMLYKGTSVANGEAVGVVVAIGTGTELGRIARLAEEAESGVPPLQQRLDRLGRRLGWLTIAIAAALALLGILVRGQEVALVVETALALGVAAIPEGLPIVATIGLARGMYLMAKRNALVNRLTAVETLGATGTILSDKTGTLTENRMRAWRLITADGDHQLGGDEPEQELTDQASRALRVGVLCSEAQLSDDGDEQSGDPTEIALLTGGRDHGLQRPELLQQWEQLRLEPFSSESKQMATFHKDQDRVLVAVKGAPEVLLGNCTRVLTESDEDEELTDSSRERWSERAEALAKDGLRVLGLADKHVESPDAEPYEELTLLGFIGLMDPPRAGVREAIHACQAAGIRVGMVTGDQPLTARAIAESVGMAGGEGGPEAVVMRGRDLVPPDQMDADLRERVLRSNIFARVAPEQKLHLVSICQDAGQVVAVTGDGVNDAPALKKADIGIAMGKRGTEAAKQVADMVLKDDAFSTIVAAVEQGRVIFANIRASVTFMLCTNVAEVLAVAIPTLIGWTLPLHPLQILYLNVITDVFPALALGVGPGSGQEMRQPPRPADEPVLTSAHWRSIAGWAGLLAACVLAALLLAENWLQLDTNAAVTVSFLTLAFGKLWFTFNLRQPGSNFLKNGITANPWVWGALALCIGLLLLSVYLPGLNTVLKTSDPGGSGWILLLSISLIPVLVGQIRRSLQRPPEVGD